MGWFKKQYCLQIITNQNFSVALIKAQNTTKKCFKFQLDLERARN